MKGNGFDTATIGHAKHEICHDIGLSDTNSDGASSMAERVNDGNETTSKCDYVATIANY